MISYCIAAYRPAYCRLLIDELIAKTSADFEILLWLNVDDPAFAAWLSEHTTSGVPLRIVGSSARNIGMAAYPRLFAESRYPLVVQIDDDVVFVSPGIAEVAAEVFHAIPQAGMLTADVWQDDLTTGARPPMTHYRPFREEAGLFDGPIDGWFAVYRRSALSACGNLPAAPYMPLGCNIRNLLRRRGMYGLLCTRMKVFHVIGPQYASHFGMLDFEIEKYQGLGRQEIVDWYQRGKSELPPPAELVERVSRIRAHLQSPPNQPEGATTPPPRTMPVGSPKAMEQQSEGPVEK